MSFDFPHNLTNANLFLIPLRLDEIEMMSLKLTNDQPKYTASLLSYVKFDPGVALEANTKTLVIRRASEMTHPCSRIVAVEIPS